jgi:hypothetical protein
MVSFRLSSDPELLPDSIARGLSVAAPVLFALYLAILAGPLFPMQLLNSGWQIRGSALINASPLSLIGLALLHLASELDPGAPLLS